MKQYRAEKGSIVDVRTGDLVAIVQLLNCSEKMRDKIAEYAVEKLNFEENSNSLLIDGLVRLRRAKAAAFFAAKR